MKSILCKALGATVLALVLAAPASAAVIFSDNFNRSEGDTVGNGWTITENDSNDVAIVDRSGSNNALRLRDDNPYAIAAQLSGISTVGWTDIALSYEWAVLSNSSSSSDYLYVEWRPGSGGWTTIGTHNLGGVQNVYSALVTGPLGLSAENVADFEFRFRILVNGSAEGALIDNVTLSGNRVVIQPDITSVPEPSTIALLGLGMLGLARLRRKSM